jgi:arsenate reductase (thioredoxin)
MLHVGFPDPGRAPGTEDEAMAVFRRVRDEMREKLVPLLEEEWQQFYLQPSCLPPQ